ncbi:agmatine deiminase family protein [Helicobacter aurati]|uniref:Agmatine deiminase family protein n=1 Tax=Helicobacter aurati TaxID=137778 RepID=A0A3D8J717_9HELI|nr:agmatine deiminase family protein [Helicobacter aurati]RDU72684.1 agmatine deiminase family protein [Helicobacter aurati]
MFAEWEKQKGVVLIYPHKFCGFALNLKEVQDCYDTIIAKILKVEDILLILHPHDEETKKHIQEVLQTLEGVAYKCHCIEIESNDVWARDCLPISVKRGKNTQTITNIANAVLGKGNWQSENLGFFGRLIEQEKQYAEDEYLHEFGNFGFNGWGLKYPANLDNQINNQIQKLGFFSNMKLRDMILEGGSIDSNGAGMLLTTAQCLLESNRNPHLTKEQIEEKLKQYLGVSTILWLTRGFLEGDRTTDGHIDTLARFISEDTIVYVQCQDSHDLHFSELQAMEKELEDLASIHNLKLVALPLCVFKEESSHLDSNKSLIGSDETLQMRYLPASYINFLFLNQKHLLMPIYQKPTDSLALQILQRALPDYTITTVDCKALITQEGSLHCATMQFH